jgi:exosortase A
MVNNLMKKGYLLALILVIFVWALVYQDALLSMEAIWARSDTFAHGYFILPISLWLIWRDKAYLKLCKVQPTWLPLPLLAISLFVSLFAYAVDINVLNQLSAVTSLIFLLWALLGNHLAWRYKFPLAYLLFAVPMGENLIPWLQDVTAWFTVFFLKLNGIPVYVDGLYIQIPTGMFEVAVACSGIRYLIASAAVGALYGYLTYQKPYKQIIFFIFALCLPILANGIRAYGIVAIAYYSDMKYATGADHLVYGWLFFGLIIMLMFWIGGKFADPEKAISSNTESNSSNSNQGYKIPATVIFLLIVTFGFLQGVVSMNPPEKAKQALSLGANFVNNEISDWGISFQNPMQQSHIINTAGFEVYRAVYGNTQDRGELISSSNKIFDTESWTISEHKEIVVAGHQASYFLLRTISGVERTIIYWFEIGGRPTLDPKIAKFMQAVEVYKAPKARSEIIAFSMKGLSEQELKYRVNEFLSNLPQMKLVN